MNFTSAAANSRYLKSDLIRKKSSINCLTDFLQAVEQRPKFPNKRE
jgi:hypothetical protein